MLTFSEIIKSFLDGKRPELAAPELAVSPRTVRNWYDGTHTPPATRIPHLSRVMGVSEDELREACGLEVVK